MHSKAPYIKALPTLPEVDIIAALQTVAAMASMMPVMLPVADPSHTVTITPRVNTTRAVSSSWVGVVFSMNTARMAVHTGIADLQAGLRATLTVFRVNATALETDRPAGRASCTGCASGRTPGQRGQLCRQVWAMYSKGHVDAPCQLYR